MKATGALQKTKYLHGLGILELQIQSPVRHLLGYHFTPRLTLTDGHAGVTIFSRQLREAVRAIRLFSGFLKHLDPLIISLQSAGSFITSSKSNFP